MIENYEFNLMLAKKNEAQNLSNTFFEGRYLIHIIDTRPIYKGDFDIFSDSLINVICRFFNLDVQKFKGRDRHKHYCDARNMYAFYIKDTYQSQISLTQLGKTIGRDHSTVIHYIQQHENLMYRDEPYTSKYLALKEMLDHQPR
jgi:chromosomal replication initiation ATPase DnaA